MQNSCAGRFPIGVAKYLFSIVLCFFACTGVQAIQVVQGVPFNSEGTLLLDLYLPDGLQPTDQRLAAILIHGGGWASGDRSREAQLGRWLAGNGMVAIAVDYKWAPAYKWPEQGIDVAQGVWWLRNNAAKYGINPKKIVSMGDSAGGHLAAMLGVQAITDPITGVSSQVQAIVSIWGPWDLTTLPTAADGFTSSEIAQDIAIRDNFLAASSDAPSASPIFRINNTTPPTLLFHGTADGTVAYRQSVNACAAFANARAAYCQLITLQGQGHDFPADLNLIATPLASFLTQWAAYAQ